jgi:hypothetical protein
MNLQGNAHRIANIPWAFPRVSACKKKQKFSANPRNICLPLFVYTSAAGIQAVAGRIEIRKQKPRGGSRGANDTQLFRLLHQDEEVSRS